MKTYRFEGIEVLRFAAALMVVFTHSFFYTSERLGQEKISWSNGAAGVDIFFIISGFVMVISSQSLTSSKGGWRQFIVKRAVRIVPLYWAATTYKLIIITLLSGVVLHSKLDWWVIIKSYFFIPSQNPDGEITPFLGVGWTLVFEMFFYTVFTFALFLRKNIYLFVGLVLLIFTMLSFVRGADYSPWWFLMDPIILEFYIGMVIGYLTLKNRSLPSVPSVIALIGSFIYLMFSPNIFGLHRVLENGIPATIIVCSVVSLEVHFQRKIPRFLIFLGTASYALYLFHPLISPIAPTILKKISIGNFPLSVVLSVSIAIFSAAIVHIWFEKPVTSYLRRKSL